MTRKFHSICITLALGFLLSGCRTSSLNGITQVAPIDALLTGVYDGHMSLETLRKYGDFGIGTFEGLDGEMVFLNGTFYKVRADGKVYQPALSEQTPFACVTEFIPDVREIIQVPTGRKELEGKVDALFPRPNRFCAFLVRGVFRTVQTRSVPMQHKPYPALTEVTKTQSVFTLTNVEGTLIGFRAPAFVKGVNVPGFHMHFLTGDHLAGGHVLEFELIRGILEADTVQEWLHIYLPTDSEAFDSADLTPDRAGILQTVEKAVRPDPENKPAASDVK